MLYSHHVGCRQSDPCFHCDEYHVSATGKKSDFVDDLVLWLGACNYHLRVVHIYVTGEADFVDDSVLWLGVLNCYLIVVRTNVTDGMAEYSA